MGTNVLKTETPTSIDDAVYFLKENLTVGDHRPSISFGFGDPSCFECFRTTPIAEEAIVEAVRSAKFNSYAPTGGILPARRKLGIVVIADEVYGHLVYGSNPFVPMSLFATTVPVITLGSIAESINKLLVYSPFPPTLIQGAIPQILEKTTQDFFSKTINILRKNLEICYDKLKEIPCMMIPQKPEGAFFAMVKLNLLLLEDIEDDMDFCLKLAKEESLIILPGVTVGLKNWLCMTFAVEYSSLEDGLGRLESFCQRHAKKYTLTGSTAVDQQIHVGTLNLAHGVEKLK
ncbi:aminotransferase TAT [Salix suchowensis]|nr:aminotransferase TAT [Salix suchowensis]